MKEVAAAMTAAINTAFQTGISGSLSATQGRKYCRNRVTKGFIRHSHTYRVRIQDRVLIDPPYNTGNDFIYEDDFSQSAYDYANNSGQTDEEGNRCRH